MNTDNVTVLLKIKVDVQLVVILVTNDTSVDHTDKSNNATSVSTDDHSVNDNGIVGTTGVSVNDKPDDMGIDEPAKPLVKDLRKEVV